jgi:outer membrane protein, heavy metal efflux system
LAFALPYTQFSYLHERDHKRELRLEGARLTTDITASTSQDQERGLIFNLRSAFVNALQAKALLQNAKENLAYWDHELGIAGDLAQVDLTTAWSCSGAVRIRLRNRLVNLRTAKIQLLMLLNDRTPIEQFDVTGPFDFTDELRPLEEYRNIAWKRGRT